MDYVRRTRLKVYVHAEAVPLDANPDLRTRVLDAQYKAKPERIIRLHLETFDWNCPQHITPRFTIEEIAEALNPVRERLAAIEAENVELRARLARQPE